MTERDDLDEVYNLQTPADAVRRYDTWADDYDTDFAQARGYVYPREVARVFLSEAGSETDPVLDVGAGTGLVAEHLVSHTVDAIDISTEMLRVAKEKGLYRNRIHADLTGPLDIADATYGALISAGTFTHGHVGPVCLPELMRIARPGALFALGVNGGVFDAAGFGSAFADLVADSMITPVDFRRISFYENADHEHAEDTGLVAVFRRT